MNKFLINLFSNLSFKKSQVEFSFKNNDIFTFFNAPLESKIEKKVSYFLKRPWGNILIYQHDGDLPFEVIKNKGGLARVFDWENIYRTKNEQIFNRYGANFVTINENETNYPTSYFKDLIDSSFDPMIYVKSDGEYMHLIIIHKKIRLLFTDPRMTKNDILKIKNIYDMKVKEKFQVDIILFPNVNWGESSFF